MKKMLLITAAAMSLSGCVTQAQSDNITKVIVGLSNKSIKDLQGVIKVANAATPPDLDGADCAGSLPDPTKPTDTGTGALAVAAAIQKVAQATTGQQVGAFTTAEILSLYQPGSAQFNWAVKTIETACVAKAHDVNQAVAGTTAGLMGIVSAFLGLG